MKIKVGQIYYWDGFNIIILVKKFSPDSYKDLWEIEMFGVKSAMSPDFISTLEYIGDLE